MKSLRKPAIIEEDCCGFGEKKNGKILAVPNKAKKFSLALSSSNRTWVAERKKQRNAFIVVFFSLPQMENLIAISSDFCIALVVSSTMNYFKRSSQHFFFS